MSSKTKEQTPREMFWQNAWQKSECDLDCGDFGRCEKRSCTVRKDIGLKIFFIKFSASMDFQEMVLNATT